MSETFMNLDDLNAALASAQRWKNSLRWALATEEALLTAQKAVGQLGEVRKAVEVAKQARDKAVEERVEATRAVAEAQAKRLLADTTAKEVVSLAKEEAGTVLSEAKRRASGLVAKAEIAVEKMGREMGEQKQVLGEEVAVLTARRDALLAEIANIRARF